MDVYGLYPETMRVDYVRLIEGLNKVNRWTFNRLTSYTKQNRSARKARGKHVISDEPFAFLVVYQNTRNVNKLEPNIS